RKARIESSTNPASLSVSVWIATCTSCSSATESAQSIAAGVVPQSSWSLSPIAPAAICSRRGSGAEALPFPRKPRLTGNADAAVTDADVGLHDPPVVHDDGVGDDDVEDAVGPGRPRRLTHPVADHLATAELRLLTSHGQVALDADQELGVGETHAVAGRRTV